MSFKIYIHVFHWFMQLNPARGRKRYAMFASIAVIIFSVYAAQPREGTETGRITSSNT